MTWGMLYVPDMKFLLHDVKEEENIFHLCYHGEKIVIAFGLIATPPGIPLWIWRICGYGDCHTATKFIAKIVMRKIIVRDANHFQIMRTMQGIFFFLNG
jgi:hypothetical protein